MNWIFFTKKIEWNDRKEPKGERERQRERESWNGTRERQVPITGSSWVCVYATKTPRGYGNEEEG